MVNWREILANIEQGGLGVRNLAEVNDCLLLKWWWRRVWSDILQLVHKRPAPVEFYLSNLKLSVGNEDRIHLWEDKWLNNLYLKEEFPRLYSLSEEKGCNCSAFVGCKEFTHYHLQTPLHYLNVYLYAFGEPLAWEEEEVLRLHELLRETPTLSLESKDSCQWMANPEGSFTVASAWKWWMYSKGPNLNVTKDLWKNFAPSKVKFCGWLVWRGRLKTVAVLKNLRVLNEDSDSLCLFCKSEEESVHHLMLFCPFVDMMQWWGLVWVLPGLVKDLLLWWSGVKFSKIVLRMWKVIPLAVMWSLWKARNECLFSGKPVEWNELAELVNVRVALWSKLNIEGMHYSVQQIVTNLHQTKACVGRRRLPLG
ncbi:uncharacterized protein LOC114264228 [Camellia sinensis]|uniref:uncharacterized protein LOC114264228 n=1 Tax=Camellia sinensis TaxID=4442 RepID=UPI001036A043|nr:uncharacterized protein LOC114264228 [Camellia sinensis]